MNLTFYLSYDVLVLRLLSSNSAGLHRHVTVDSDAGVFD